MPCILVLAGGLGFSAWAWRNAKTLEDHQRTGHLEAATKAAGEAVRERIDACSDFLYALRAFFVSSISVEREEWKDFISELRVDRRFPCSDGLGHAVRVSPAEIEKHVDAARKDGAPRYSVWPPGSESDLFPILYMEPADAAGARALGFDLSVDPVLRAAMADARDTGSVIASGRASLSAPGTAESRTATYLFCPLYRRGAMLHDFEDRRSALSGYVFCELRFDDVLAGRLDALGPSAGIRVLQGAGEAAEPVFPANAPLERGVADDLASRRASFIAAGRPWTVALTASPALAAASTAERPSVVLSGGMALACLLIGVTWLLARARNNALLSARAAMAELERANAALRSEVEERRRAEESLRETSAALEKGGNGISLLDTNGTFVSVNEAYAATLGYSAAELVGKHWSITVHPEQLERAQAIHDAMRAQGKADGIILGLRKGGATFWRGVTLVAAADAQGRPRGHYCFARDVTAQVEAQKAAEAANQAKSSFLANVSHEIRTPMTAILGYADLLLDDEAPPDEKRGYLHVIRQNGQHLLAVLNDILDLSKIEAGKIAIQRVPVSPVDLVREIAGLMKLRAKEKNLAFEVDFVGPIPERIESDPTRLRQILLNIVGNALKFTEVGTVRLLTTYFDPEESGRGLLCFEVVDSGIGMTAEQKKKLFRAFSQADDTTSRRFGGTGLGLAISKRFAQLLGGDIVVQTNKDEGTSFIVAVETGGHAVGNMLDGSGLDPWQERFPAPRSEPAPTRLEGRILLVEDIEVNRRLIAKHLATAGATIEMAMNGADAIEKALSAEKAGRPFDLVLMDMQMPVLDGYSATTELRKQGFGRPIVALTAHAMSGDRERCLEAGCTDFLTKPIDKARLVSVISQHLRGEPPRAASILEPLTSRIADDPEMGEILADFLEWMPAQVKLLRSAVDAADHQVVRETAHALKGTSGSCGFPGVMEAAYALEKLARDRADVQAVRAAMQALEALTARIDVSQAAAVRAGQAVSISS